MKTFGPDAPNSTRRRELFAAHGAILDVIIRREPGAPPSDDVRDFFECGGLIDTGASVVGVDYRIAHALGLRQVDTRQLLTPAGSVEVGVFLAELDVPQLGWRHLISVYAAKVSNVNYNVLLGRSFLSEFVVTFDGPNGFFHFYDPQAGLTPPPEDE